MKILVVTHLFPAHSTDHEGGFVLDSILALANEGHEIFLLVTRPWVPSILNRFWPGLKKRIDFSQILPEINVSICYHLSIPRYYLRWISNKIYIKKVSSEIENLARFSKFDLIHAHSEFTAIPAVIAGKKLSIPVVATAHGVESFSKAAKRYWSASEKLISVALPKLNRLILVGSPLIPFFKTISNKHDHFVVVPNGFKLSQQILDTHKVRWSATLKIVSVSNLADEGKCIDVTLHALAELLKQGRNDWIYKIVGDGIKRNEYQALVESLDLKDKVQFVGACSHQAVYHHLSQADIFCLPSCREAFGIAHLEAMAFGLLTIGVIGQGPQTFIEHGKTGLLVEPKNVNSLTKTLNLIIENSEEMRLIADAGRQHALENFTWKKHAEKLISVYKEACGQ